MESNLALVSPKPVLGLSSLPNPTTLYTKQCFGLPLLPRKPSGSFSVSRPRSKTLLFASNDPNSQIKSSLNDIDIDNGSRIKRMGLFASTSRTSKGKETTSVGVNPPVYTPPPPSQVGNPLFWFGVGVGFSALYSFVVKKVKEKAMQQVYKTMMGSMGSQNNQFSNTMFSPGSPFGFPPPSTSGPSSYPGITNAPPFNAGPKTITGSTSSGPYQATSPAPAASEAAIDASASKVDYAEPVVVKDETEVKTEAKQSAFMDVSPEETFQKSPFEDFGDSSSQTSSTAAKWAEVVQNGAASKESTTSSEGTASDWSQSTGNRGSGLSVEDLERMMEDPAVFQMMIQHLPEQMRDPATFKLMLQNPLYRQQLQDMLDNMGGTSVMDNLKNFNINSPEVKQQFDELGLTPQEVVSKIMANPDVAMAFQNPRVQQAIMDCQQNPMNILKYQNDEEVMTVFSKIQQLFPGAGGPGGF